MTDALFEAGLKVRKQVLGEDYVSANMENADEFAMALQQFVTTHAWGALWTREGLPLKTRSMLNLAMLAALNRPHELKVHLRGALTNGVSKEEIAEIFLQVAVYAGFPCAVDAFRQARELFREQED